MKNSPLTKLKFFFNNLYQKQPKQPVSNLFNRANIEQKWWMGEDVFTNEKNFLKKRKISTEI